MTAPGAAAHAQADRATFLHSPSPPPSKPSTPDPPPDPTTTTTTMLATPATALYASPSTPAPTTPAALRRDLATHGYVRIPSFLAPHALSALRHAAAHAAAQARAGAWPHIRTLPKQFPPWPADASNGIWGVQHLLHPAMPGRAAFVRLYFAPRLLDLCASLLGDSDSESAPRDALVLELLNLLVRPDADFALRWHRDAVPLENVSRADEARALGVPFADGDDTPAPPKGPRRHVQYNIALHADASLILVPGSHRRPRTAHEEALFAADAYAPTDSVPGATALRLAPGDIVFYDNNVLHRGVYDAGAERLTLHGSVGDARGGGGAGRAQNVLQHGVGEWISGCAFAELGDEGVPERMVAEGMRARLVDLGRRAGTQGTKGIHDG